MYGTTARMRLVPGSEAIFRAHLDALQAYPVEGWICTTYSHSDADPRDVWLSVVYESEELYREAAKSMNQHALWTRLRSILEADPDWHDGEVLYHAVPAAK
jgi:hypothetical protein